MVVADALVWEGADERLLRACENGADFAQYLLRALIYRAVADRLARLDEPMRRTTPIRSCRSSARSSRRDRGRRRFRAIAPHPADVPEPIENLASQVGALSASGKASAEHTLP